MKNYLKALWADFSRYPISGLGAVLFVVMSFSARAERMDYLILAYLFMLSPRIVKDET